jgi:hypothetical protein
MAKIERGFLKEAEQFLGLSLMLAHFTYSSLLFHKVFVFLPSSGDVKGRPGVQRGRG